MTIYTTSISYSSTIFDIIMHFEIGILNWVNGREID